MVDAVLEVSARMFQHLRGIRHTMWKKINWREDREEVPSSKMKTHLGNIVPLSGQALEVSKCAESITGRFMCLFQNGRSHIRAGSDSGFRSALPTLGCVNREMTPMAFARWRARCLMRSRALGSSESNSSLHIAVQTSSRDLFLCVTKTF